MATRTTIEVGLDDKTQAGNASVVANAKATQQTLAQSQAEKLAEMQAKIEAYARDNQATLLNSEAEGHRKSVELFEQLLQRKKKAEEKYAAEAAEAAKPLTTSQQHALSVAREIVARTPDPAPIVQRVVNDVEPINQQTAPRPVVQRVVNDAETVRATPQPVPITQRLDVDAGDIAQGSKFAGQAIEELRQRTETLMAAFQRLREGGIDNVSDAAIAKFAALSRELDEARTRAELFANQMRELGQQSGGSPLTGFAASVEREVQQSKTAIEGFTAKVTQEEEEQRRAATRTANIIDEVRDQQATASMRRAESAATAFVQAEAEQQQTAQRTASVIETVRAQQSAAGDRAAEAAARAFIQSETEKQAAAEKTASVLAHVRAQQAVVTEATELAAKLNTAATAATHLSDEMESVGFPADSVDEARALAAQIDKTREAARLAADMFDAMGQTNAANRLRDGLRETTGATQQLRHAIAQAGVRELAAEMQKAGNTAQHMSGGLDASGQAARRLKTALADMGIPKLTAEMNRVEAAARGAAGNRAAMGGGIMQLAYAADDLQYGFRSIVNNIPGILMGLGVGGGLAGVISLAAVAISVLLPKIEQLAEKLGKDGFAKTATDGIEALTQKNRQLALAMQEVAQVTLQTDDAKLNNQDRIDNLKKEIAEYERLGQVKATQKALGDALKENAEQAGNRAAERARAELDTVEKVDARIKGLQAYIDQQGGNGLHTIAPDSVEQVKSAVTELGKLQAQRERFAEADAKKAKEATDSKADAAFEREAAARTRELKSLDQIEERLHAIAVLKAGKSTGISGAVDLGEKDRKRLEKEESSLQEKRVVAITAINDRLQENARLAAESIEKSRDQAAELDKQLTLATALRDIERQRADVASGADNPRGQEARAQSEAQREAFLERVKAKTGAAHQASQQANADETASEDTKRAKRDAYSAAVQNQITAEANIKRQRAAEQAAFEQQQAVKNLALDQNAIAIRQQAVADANAELATARANDEAADRDRGAGAEDRRRKATADLAKAEAEKLKAEAELRKQIESNEARRRDTADKNQQQATRQRIADEVAVGKAREKALMDAAAREQAIEDAKNAKRQGALEKDPRVQAAVQQIQQRIKPRDVEARAIQKRKDAAEAKFRKERKGQKIKPGEVAKARDKAGNQFRKDVKAGKPQAQAELADAADELLQGVVDKTRGLSDQLAKALKALSRGPVEQMIEAANLEQDVEQVEKQKPGDKAAQRKADAKAKAEKLKKDKADAKAKAEREEGRRELEAIDAARKAEEEAEARDMEAAEKAAFAKEEQRRLTREQEAADELAAENAATEQRRTERAEREAQAERQKQGKPGEPEPLNVRQQKLVDDAKKAQAEPDQQREAPQFFADDQPAKSVPPTPDLANPPPPQSGQQDAALKAAENAMKMLGDQQAKTDGNVLDALQKLTQLVTDQANAKAQQDGVVQQVVDHVNQLQGQLVAQQNTTRMSQLRAGAV